MEPTISPIGRNSEVERPGWLPAEEAPQAVQMAKSKAVEEAAAAEAADKAAESSAETKTPRTHNPMADVSLKFKIDDETNDVTILIMDKLTHKVMRTIPADEMSKMKPGDLLELFA